MYIRMYVCAHVQAVSFRNCLKVEGIVKIKRSIPILLEEASFYKEGANAPDIK